MIFLRFILLSLLVLSPFIAAEEFREVSWDDLMPKDWVPTAPQKLQFSEEFGAQGLPQSEIAPIVNKLNKQKLKIPGYVIPTKFEGGSISEFLLVPYMGACIHTPPPPENQLVYVTLKEPLNSQELWAPVWVSGLMTTQVSMTKFATAGYHMKEAITQAYEY